MPFLVDSDVLIDVSRDRSAAIEYVEALPDRWVISQVTAMELLVGARDKNEIARLDKFLAAFPVVPLDPSIGERAYWLLRTYARSHGLHVFDSLIAGTALECGLALVTRNRRHFSMIQDLVLVVPEY
jgi:predicted nucleic acid-binding protein